MHPIDKHFNVFLYQRKTLKIVNTSMYGIYVVSIGFQGMLFCPLAALPYPLHYARDKTDMSHHPPPIV